jgi:endonuclease-3
VCKRPPALATYDHRKRSETAALGADCMTTRIDGMAVHQSWVLREVNKRLKIYGNDRHSNRQNPLEELVFIVLSAQTEAYSYKQVFGQLRKHFRNWNSMLGAPISEIESVIRPCGLARKKSRQLKSALQKIKSDTGKLSLAFLRRLPNERARRYLMSLPGVGHKTASCIMMYSLRRQVFPVDTHVWRVCRRLGLAPMVPKPTISQEEELESKVPRRIRYYLHVNMMSHGQQVCSTYWPRCDECVLADLCPSRNKPDGVWGTWRQPRGVWARALQGA